jgi:hypothetical protein
VPLKVGEIIELIETNGWYLTREEMTNPVNGLGDLMTVLREADPATSGNRKQRVVLRLDEDLHRPVIAELHTFLVAEGVHPATALGWFTDSLAFATYHPEPGE